MVINTLLCVAVILLTYFCMRGWGTLVKVVCYSLAGLGFLVALICFLIKKQAIFKSAFVLVCCLAVTVAVIAAISEAGHLNDYPTDAEKTERLVEIINASGGWGMFVYFLIQVLQVVVLPLPAAVCYIPGSLIWGPLVSTLLASAGVIVGSVIAYCIGKIFGKRAVVWIAGKETTDKYCSYLSKRGKVLFVLMQILPFFPDDILCMVVGLTGMNFWFFLITIVVVRPFIIAAYCYLGSGTVIPFSGWGIAVWIAIFAVCILLAVLSFKYQDRVEKWLVNKFTRGKQGEKGDSVPAVESAEVTDENTAESVNSPDDVNDDNSEKENESGDGGT